MRKTLLVVLTLLSFYPLLAQQTQKLVDSYIPVKDALIKGDSKTTSVALKKLQQTLHGDNQLVKNNDLDKAIGKMLQAANLEQQRAAFNAVSVSLWSVVKEVKDVKTPIFYQYCPMKKAYWLSTEKAIKNPYYGDAMLSCGTVAETKK